MILRANLLELLNGSDGKLSYIINNGTFGFYVVFTWKFYFYKFNDANEFQGSKLSGLIEWESKVGDKPSFSLKNWFHIGFIRESCNLFARDLDIGFHMVFTWR